MKKDVSFCDVAEDNSDLVVNLPNINSIIK